MVKSFTMLADFFAYHIMYVVASRRTPSDKSKHQGACDQQTTQSNF